MAVKRNQPVKNIFFWLGAGLLLIILWSLLQSPGMVKNDITFSQFVDDVEAETQLDFEPVTKPAIP